MRIAFFSDNFYPELSGISDSILDISKILARNGHVVRIYAPKYSKGDYEKSNFAWKEIELGANVSVKRLFSFQFKSSPTGQSRVVLPSFLFLSDIKRFNPDVIHLHLPFGMGFNALAAAKIFRKPLIGTSHTPVTEFLAYSPIKILKKGFFALRLLSWFYNRCDFVSAPSESVFKEMKENGFIKKNAVVSNPIDNRLFCPVSSDTKKFLKKKFVLKENVILYTGRLAKEKNINIILEALVIVRKTIPAVSMLITGHGAEEDNLKKLAKDLDLSSLVVFAGTVDTETLVEYHQLSDVFVIMSTAESQSISLMRSFSVGVPAIAADARALPEYVTSERGFLVKPNDHKDLSKKIIQLLENEPLRRELGGNGVAFIEKISIKNIGQAWEKIYSDAIAHNQQYET